MDWTHYRFTYLYANFKNSKKTDLSKDCKQHSQKRTDINIKRINSILHKYKPRYNLQFPFYNIRIALPYAVDIYAHLYIG